MSVKKISFSDKPDEESYDLVIARKVLEHLSHPELALKHLAAAVRPGGWLHIEDTDLATFRRFSCSDPERVDRAYLSFIEAMSRKGFQPTFAKHLKDLMCNSGFEDVEFVCPIPVGFNFPTELGELGLRPLVQKHLPRTTEWNAADEGVGKVYRLTFERLRDLVLNDELLSQAEVDEFFETIATPGFGAATGFHCAAWGRKPCRSR